MKFSIFFTLLAVLVNFSLSFSVHAKQKTSGYESFEVDKEKEMVTIVGPWILMPNPRKGHAEKKEYHISSQSNKSNVCAYFGDYYFEKKKKAITFTESKMDIRVRIDHEVEKKPFLSLDNSYINKIVCKFLKKKPTFLDGPTILVEHSGWVNTLTFHPSGKYFASGSDDDTVKIWDAKNNNIVVTLHEHMDDVHALSFSPDGKHLLSGAYDNTIKVWDFKGRKSIATLTKHLGPVRAISWSPKGKYFISGGNDNSIKVWEFSSLKVVATIDAHNNKVNSLSFSPDGKYIVSTSDDKSIKVWNFKSRKLHKTFKGHDFAVNTAIFSPNGQYILSGSSDKTIKIWSPQSGKLLWTLKGHVGGVNEIVFGPQGKYFASAADGGSIKVWHLKSRKLVKTLKGESLAIGQSNDINGLTWSPDGKKIISGSTEHLVSVWPVTYK